MLSSTASGKRARQGHALREAFAATRFVTPPHPERPAGWVIAWGDPDAGGLDVRPLRFPGERMIDRTAVAGYLRQVRHQVHRRHRPSLQAPPGRHRRLLHRQHAPGPARRRLLDARSTGGRTELGPDAALPNQTELVVTSWAFVGIGWRTTGDALLAQTSAALARQRRRIAREEAATG